MKFLNETFKSNYLKKILNEIFKGNFLNESFLKEIF